MYSHLHCPHGLPMGDGHRGDVTAIPMSQPWTVGGSSPLLSLGYSSAHRSHGGSCSQGCSLDRVRWCWDRLDWVCDWAWVRPLSGLSGFWCDVDRNGDVLILWPCKTTLYVSSLAYLSAAYKCHLFNNSPCPPGMGASLWTNSCSHLSSWITLLSDNVT